MIEAVRDLSLALFAPIGASKAQRARVHCFTEVPFTIGKGKGSSRPDGLVQITYGRKTWSALVEVKTGRANLDPDQINAYWDIARQHDFDAVITISNEIAPSKGIHPTEGLKVRSNSKVQVHHYSWTALWSMCEVLTEHRGVDDPEQAWLLGELIRYLRHPRSGATTSVDMGSDWVAARDGARDQSLRRSDPAVRDLAFRWDQLLRFAALRLEADIGQEVSQLLPAAQRGQAQRPQHLADRLVTSGHLDGTLRIPNTIGDLEVSVDLRARRIVAAVSFPAPDDRGARARCSWLARQLGPEVDDRLIIDAYPKMARTPTTTRLERVRNDRNTLLDDEKREPARFRLSLSREMGTARNGGQKATGFMESVVALITDFYGTVIQDLSPWTPKAPRISNTPPPPEPDVLAESAHLLPTVDQPATSADKRDAGPGS